MASVETSVQSGVHKAIAHSLLCPISTVCVAAVVVICGYHEETLRWKTIFHGFPPPMYKTLPIVTFDMIVRVYENESGMETGNRSWKWKSEMKKQNTPITGAGYCERLVVIPFLLFLMPNALLA